MKDCSIFIDADKTLRTRAVGKDGDHHAGVILGGEFAIYLSRFHIAAIQGKSSRLMIGRNDHKRVSILFARKSSTLPIA